MHFKKYILCCLFLCAATATQAAITQATVTIDSNYIKKIKSIADAVGKTLAPDKRTAVYNFKIDSNAKVLALETTEPAAAETLQKALQNAKLQLTVQPTLLPAADLGNKLFAVVSLSVSNNRKEPGHAAEMMTQMIMGTPVQLLKRERGYFLVRSPDNYISWVDRDALALMDEKQLEDWKNTGKLIYKADYGYSFSRPDVNAIRVSDLVKGDIFKLLGQEKGFYKIAYPDQRIAFIPVKEAEDYRRWVNRANPNATQILNTAKTLMGVPYLWGGTSIKGVDCSGFTKVSYFLNGIILPRDASQQALVGEALDIYEADTVNLAKCLKTLLPGDLLFFAAAKGKSPNPRVTHTAIYMGNGQFIQSAGMVRINSMDPAATDYTSQSRTIVSARRMLNSIGSPEIIRIDQHPLYTTVSSHESAGFNLYSVAY
jgi:cell wall-associated NlpC family hydrolase